MAVKRMVPNAVHFREFQNDPITGHRYHGTCGETALATAEVSASPPIETTQQAIDLMMSRTRDMMNLNWADRPDGVTNMGHLHEEAIRNGFTIGPSYIQWEDPIPSAVLHPLLLQYAGVMPIVLMVTHAGEGLHAIDGSHAEAGVQGHFITIVGLADEGYVTNDGDNNVIADHLVIYPWAAIEKAHVTGFMMLELQGVSPVAVPSSWTLKSDGTIAAPNGVPVIAGFADHIKTNAWADDNWPEEAEQKNVLVEPYGNPGLGVGSRQIFRKSMLGWTSAKGVYETWLGQEHLAALAHIKDLEAKLAASGSQAEVDALKAQVASDEAEIAKLQASQNPPLSNQQKADLQVLADLRTALASHA